MNKEYGLWAFYKNWKNWKLLAYISIMSAVSCFIIVIDWLIITGNVDITSELWLNYRHRDNIMVSSYEKSKDAEALFCLLIK